jgi:Fe-S cluster assembly iron-binding protein IscA
MLTLTDQATTKLRTIMEGRDIPATGGMRLSKARRGVLRFTVAMVDGPLPGDEVVARGGTRVFLDSTAAAVVANRVLDTQPKEGGGARFVLNARPTAAPDGNGGRPERHLAPMESEGRRGPFDTAPDDNAIDATSPDFARGQRHLSGSAGDEPYPDFARGQRELVGMAAGSERSRPDFARGQDSDDDDDAEHRRRGSFATGQLVGGRT